MIHNIKDVLTADNLNGWVAGLAVLSPFWLPWLEDFSKIAALLLPIIGLAWFGVQIWAKIYRNK